MRRIVSASLPVLAIALLLAAMAGCSRSAGSALPSPTLLEPSPSGSPSPAPSATPEPTSSPDAPTPSPGPTWPPVGPAPSAAQAGTMYLAHLRWSDTSGPVQMTTILEDGWMVIVRWDEPGTRWLVRQLSPTGLAAVRAQVAAVGLFDKSQTRQIVKSPNCCGAGDEIDITTASGTVKVSRLLLPPASYAPSAAWDRFDRLVNGIAAPDAWVSKAGWATPTWVPYHAAAFCLTLNREPIYPTTPAALLTAANIDWPAGVQPFESFGQPASQETIENMGPIPRMGPIDASAAYDLASSIVAAAAAAGVPNDGLARVPLEAGGEFRSPWIADPPGWTLGVSLTPMPPGPARCP